MLAGESGAFALFHPVRKIILKESSVTHPPEGAAEDAVTADEVALAPDEVPLTPEAPLAPEVVELALGCIILLELRPMRKVS